MRCDSREMGVTCSFSAVSAPRPNRQWSFMRRLIPGRRDGLDDLREGGWMARAGVGGDGVAPDWDSIPWRLVVCGCLDMCVI